MRSLDVMTLGSDPGKTDVITDSLFGFTKFRILSFMRFVKTYLRKRFILGMSENVSKSCPAKAAVKLDKTVKNNHRLITD